MDRTAAELDTLARLGEVVLVSSELLGAGSNLNMWPYSEDTAPGHPPM